MKNEKIKKKRTRRKILWGRVIIFLFILGILCAALALAFYHTYEAGKSVYQEYHTMLEEFERKKSLQLKLQDERFSGYTNILLLGIDDGDKENGGRRSDSMMVASIENETGYIHLLSIPRDTKVSIPGRRAEEKINRAYYYGGVQLSVRTVENLLQVPIQHYVVVDMEVFSEIIDKLGGIYIYIENDMDYEDPYADLAIHLKQGYQYLDGGEAAHYMRYRSDELGDIGRVQRQQKFMKAFYGELFKMNTLVQLPALLNIADRRITTSLSVMDIACLAGSIQKCSADRIKTQMLPGTAMKAEDGSYWAVDGNAMAAMLDEIFKREEK